MSNALAQTQVVAAPQRKKFEFGDLENIIVNGDISRMTETQRMQYLSVICESLGLNPLTKPFDYISFQGKLTLYARKDCTEQLRKIHGVTTHIVSKELIEDIYTVTARARDSEGREDEDIGCVNVSHLKGEALCNAYMKAMTKAKRRVTLSICGLGFLDESELDTMPGARPLNSLDSGPKKESPLMIVPPQSVQRPTRDELINLSANAKSVFKEKEIWEKAFAEKFPGKKLIDLSLDEYAAATNWIQELYFLQCENT